jgi:hypothetical protein
MIIEINYSNGYMHLDANYMIDHMWLVDYKKRFAPLFAEYGTSEQQKAFLQLLDETIEGQAKIFNMVASASPLVKSRVNGAFNKLKRYKTMRDVLKGLLS